MRASFFSPLRMFWRCTSCAFVTAVTFAVSFSPARGASNPSAAEKKGGNVLAVAGADILLNGAPIKIKGLRCSAALISDATTDDLIGQLDSFRGYGVNTISVYLMGSRFADVKGYRPDGSLDPVYAARLDRIITAADARGMIVLVGCLYWSTSRAKEELGHWTQADANRAVANTVAWLKARRHRNVFVDPDNEGMALAEKKWSIAAMIDSGRAANPECVFAYNSRRPAPANADLAIHHSPRISGKPYVETEGSPPGSNYWGPYSKRDGLYNYINVGVYTEEMKQRQLAATTEHIEGANGYMLASTWLQAPPPLGPKVLPGGDGAAANPGIRWWLDFLRERYGRDAR
ncbi:MAG: hypothetical protein Q7S40_13490 [Opitutaceae bacterium]|nr:hypothetical protein [Opitutaceae bacterium]